eukprot:GHVS01098092.1.p1 GENE.GHVS01098092.1~~GHVS01098092.1.p1  ORF type:complete len:365 (+),score=17.48 GHVS01098092.1:34-1095(+)
MLLVFSLQPNDINANPTSAEQNAIDQIGMSLKKDDVFLERMWRLSEDANSSQVELRTKLGDFIKSTFNDICNVSLFKRETTNYNINMLTIKLTPKNVSEAYCVLRFCKRLGLPQTTTTELDRTIQPLQAAAEALYAAKRFGKKKIYPGQRSGPQGGRTKKRRRKTPAPTTTRPTQACTFYKKFFAARRRMYMKTPSDISGLLNRGVFSNIWWVWIDHRYRPSPATTMTEALNNYIRRKTSSPFTVKNFEYTKHTAEGKTGPKYLKPTDVCDQITFDLVHGDKVATLTFTGEFPAIEQHESSIGSPTESEMDRRVRVESSSETDDDSYEDCSTDFETEYEMDRRVRRERSSETP